MTGTGGLTVLNRYDLLGTADDFRHAVTALAARVEAEGERGILSYRFFVNGADRSARAVVVYDSPAAWIGHHDTAMLWPEMKALHAVARLAEAVFLGEVPPAIRDWLAGSSLTATVVTGHAPAAGFDRQAR